MSGLIADAPSAAKRACVKMAPLSPRGEGPKRTSFYSIAGSSAMASSILSCG